MDGTKKVCISTSYGDIKIKLYNETPKHRDNFIKLAKEAYFDGTLFHRVIKDFMIQGGDPTGTGMGGPGYTIQDEFSHKPKNTNIRGTIAMANSGPNTGGSQFFINLVNNNFLDTKHPAFGKVISGMDVIDKIAKVQTDSNDKPLTPVRMISVRIK